MPPDTPVFTVTGATHTSYLRSTAIAVYRQGQWYIEDGTTANRYTDETILTPDIKLRQTSSNQIIIQPIVTFASGFIPTALYTTRIYDTGSLEYYPEAYAFKTLSSFSSSYSFDTVHFDDSQTPESAQILVDDIYLQIPDEITQRTRELAEQIVKGINSPLIKARTIEQYLKTTYEYDPEYEEAPEGEEPIDWFLFTEKKGVCANFNSAFVILSRRAGVPSRLVTARRATTLS